MSKRELITRELDQMPEEDLDKLLAFLRALRESHVETAMPTLAAESALAKDCLRRMRPGPICEGRRCSPELAER